MENQNNLNEPLWEESIDFSCQLISPPMMEFRLCRSRSAPPIASLLSGDNLTAHTSLFLLPNLSGRDSIQVVEDIMETSKVRQNCIVDVLALLLLMICGAVFLMLVEKLEAVDSFYCACVTIMSLGYGDYGFSTEAGRIFAILWILTTTICLGLFFLHLAELSTERRQNALVRWVITGRATIVDLEAAATDIDGGVEVAEFVLYKLKDMGKITQNDISVVMKEFKVLDFDQP